ncbi:MAG: M28 family peptidase [Flavobacteriales bacterium]|nr:M28 family peptidase [Flavobacteriales bacterium]MBP9078893.1 M28 family peptidase [Flavobacteriales bacterium]
MRIPLFFAPLLLAGALWAQDQPPVKDRARSYVDTLAGRGMYGRGYVNGGDSLAADWIAGQFDRIGLAKLNKTRFEPFTFPVNTFPDSIRLAVDGRVLIPGVDFLVDPASGTATGSYELVHLTLQDLLTPERKALTLGVVLGHAVVLHFPATGDPDTLALYRALETELSRAVPVIRQGGEKLTWSVAATQARNAIIEVRQGLLSDTAATAVIHVENRFVPKHRARNVWGVAKGRGKDWLLVTAHYDHLGMMGQALFPGANDNASGVSMLLTLAERFRKHPTKLNILFVAFAGEEAGLRGSEWFLVDRPMDLGRIRMVINLDLNGTGDDGITVVNATEQQDIFNRLATINKRTKALPQVKARGPACNSDHCPFAKKGIPAIFIYTMGGVSHYHDVYDRAETLPLTKFNELYRTLVALIGELK